MQIGAGTSPMSSYVAFTRVKKMEDLLLFRPFDRSLFTQGDLEGPQLLLKVLRGEAIDWHAVEQEHMPSHMCCGCDTKVFKADFAENQWKRKDKRRHCKDCERNLSHGGVKKQCKWCGEWQPGDQFDPNVWRKRDPSELFCRSCGDKRKCRGCEEMKPHFDFTDGEWSHAAKPNHTQGRCKKCLRRQQDLRWCCGCGQHLPKEHHFSQKMWQHVKDSKRKCNACSQAPSEKKVKTQPCSGCQEELTQEYFSLHQWEKVAAKNRTCTNCQTGPNSEKRKGEDGKKRGLELLVICKF